MTKAEYNTNLKRFKKAMDWYNTKPPTDQQEKYLPAFEELLETLRFGVIHLQANEKEIWNGFN